MSYFVRVHRLAQAAKEAQSLPVSVVRLCSSSSTPPSSDSTSRAPSSGSTTSGTKAPQSTGSEVPPTSAGSPYSSSSSSGPAHSAGSTSSSTPPPPPPPPQGSAFFKRYRVVLTGSTMLAGACLVIPFYYLYGSLYDGYTKKLEARRRNAPPSAHHKPAAVMLNTAPSLPEPEEESGSSANESLNNLLHSDSRSAAVNSLPVAASSVSPSEAPKSSSPTSVPSQGSAVEQEKSESEVTDSPVLEEEPSHSTPVENVAEVEDKTHVMSSGSSVEATGDSTFLETKDVNSSSSQQPSEPSPVPDSLEETNKAKLEQLAAEMKEKMEEARKEASLNLDVSLENLLRVANLASGLYTNVTSESNEITRLTYTNIESLVQQCPDDSSETTMRISELRTSLAQYESKLSDLRTALPTCIAILDTAARVVQELGDLEEANASSQKASAALKSLHQQAEHAAQAEADLAVMVEYQTQVQQRIERHQQRMLQLESAQLQAIERASHGGDEDVDAAATAKSVYDRDVQALLSFAQQRVNVMEQNLTSGRERQTKDMAALLEQQRAEDQHVMQLKLDHLRQQLEREHAEELLEKKLEAHYKLEEELKTQMRRQAAAHLDHLQVSLQDQAKSLTEEWRNQLETELRAQAAHHSKQVDSFSEKIRDAREELFQSAAAVESGRTSHRLWQSCMSLADCMSYTSQCPPLQSVVQQIRTEAGSNPLIAAAIDTIPASALDKGVQTERMLAQRFPVVRQSCERVAMVPEDGSHGFWTYAMSYAHSLITFPSRNLSSDSVSLATMETCDLLALGEEKLCSGDLEQAVRVVNQLRGQPRVLAQNWLDQARLLLATRQAVDIILSELLLVRSVGPN